MFNHLLENKTYFELKDMSDQFYEKIENTHKTCLTFLNTFVKSFIPEDYSYSILLDFSSYNILTISFSVDKNYDEIYLKLRANSEYKRDKSLSPFICEISYSGLNIYQTDVIIEKTNFFIKIYSFISEFCSQVKNTESGLYKVILDHFKKHIEYYKQQIEIEFSIDKLLKSRKDELLNEIISSLNIKHVLFKDIYQQLKSRETIKIIYPSVKINDNSLFLEKPEFEVEHLELYIYRKGNSYYCSNTKNVISSVFDKDYLENLCQRIYQI